MRLTKLAKVIVSLIVAVAVVAGYQFDAAAQCSMCRAALAGSNNPFFIRNFNIGVLVLLIPPVAMFCSFFVVLRRHKLRDDAVSSEEAQSSDIETRS